MSPPEIDLRLPPRERALAASLGATWRDFLYAPGPGLTSPLDPGACRSTFVAVPVVGVPVRISSLVAPALGGRLCRLRLEPLERFRPESLGSFFEPSRTGTIHTFTPDRTSTAARAPDRAEWRYEGPALASRLGRVGELRLLRERGRERGGGISWQADRGIVLTDVDGAACLLLSLAETSEAALFLPSVGLHRALLDRDGASAPGVSVRGLLGYDDWPADLEVAVELRPL